LALESGFTLSIVTIDVSDWEGMVDFYQDVLGLNAIELEPEQRYGWLDAGTVVLAFRGVDDEQEGSGTSISLQFEVDDIEKAIEELEAAGAEFYDKQLDGGDEGYRIAHFYDPEGHALAIYNHEHEDDEEEHDHRHGHGHEHDHDHEHGHYHHEH
jgi:predicted enzyme related to lactoylglutathione lyase